MNPEASRVKVIIVFLTALVATAGWVAAQEVLYVINDKVGIGNSTPAQKLDIVTETYGGIRVADGTTDTTTKRFRLYAGHYTNAQPDILLFSSVSNGTVNTADFGGGAAAYNAATTVRFWTASSATTTGGSIRMVINSNGNVGIGTTGPAYPLQMASGAHVTAGGVWTNASSRDYKENIADLPLDAALATVMNLEPVTYDYKNTGGEHHAGFIAEDVPDLVATSDRKGLSTMDIVAVLTKVVQQQQQTIDELNARLEALENK